MGDDEEIEEGEPAEEEARKKKHRKHRRHRVHRELEEDDLELINENLPGFKKRKRLLKVSERDKGVEGEDFEVKGEPHSEEDEDAQVY